MKLRLIAQVVLTIAALARVCATDHPETEPNNTFPPTDYLGVFQSGDRITGNISSASDVDYFYLDTAGTGKFGLYRYTFVTQGLPGWADSELMIFDTEQQVDEYGTPIGLLNDNDDAYTGVYWSRAIFDAWTNGQNLRWGVFIEGHNANDIWPYAIQVTFEPIQFVEAGQYNAGSITFDTLQSSGLSNGIADTVLTLFDSAGHVLAFNDDDTNDDTWLSKITTTLGNGDYYICVSTSNTYPVNPFWPGLDRTGVGPGSMFSGDYVLSVNGTTFNGTIQPGYAYWYHAVVGPPAKTVSGTVTLENYVGNPSGVPITFEIRQTGTTTVLETATGTLASDGSYSFTGHQSGVVDVAAKGSVWLRAVQQVDFSGSTSGVNYTLLAGDADGNNWVALPDLSTVLANYNQTGAGIAGDLDGSQTVGIADLSIVLSNFNVKGAP